MIYDWWYRTFNHTSLFDLTHWSFPFFPHVLSDKYQIRFYNIQMFKVVDIISLRPWWVVFKIRNNMKKNVFCVKKIFPQIVANLPGNWNSIDICSISDICIDRHSELWGCFGFWISEDRQVEVLLRPSITEWLSTGVWKWYWVIRESAQYAFLCSSKIIGTLRELGSLSVQGLLKHTMVFSDLSVSILLCFGMVAPFFCSLWSRHIDCILTICPYMKGFLLLCFSGKSRKQYL